MRAGTWPHLDPSVNRSLRCLCQEEMLEWPLTLLRHYPLGLARMQRSLSWEFLGYIHTRQGQAPFQYLINSKKASSLLVLWDEGSLKVKRNCFLSLQRHPSLWSACGVCHLLEQSRDKLWLICILSPSLLIKFLFLYFPYLVTTFFVVVLLFCNKSLSHEIMTYLRAENQ